MLSQGGSSEFAPTLYGGMQPHSETKDGKYLEWEVLRTYNHLVLAGLSWSLFFPIHELQSSPQIHVQKWQIEIPQISHGLKKHSSIFNYLKTIQGPSISLGKEHKVLLKEWHTSKILIPPHSPVSLSLSFSLIRTCFAQNPTMTFYQFIRRFYSIKWHLQLSSKLSM